MRNVRTCWLICKETEVGCYYVNFHHRHHQMLVWNSALLFLTLLLHNTYYNHQFFRVLLFSWRVITWWWRERAFAGFFKKFMQGNIHLSYKKWCFVVLLYISYFYFKKIITPVFYILLFYTWSHLILWKSKFCNKNKRREKELVKHFVKLVKINILHYYYLFTWERESTLSYFRSIYILHIFLSIFCISFPVSLCNRLHFILFILYFPIFMYKIEKRWKSFMQSLFNFLKHSIRRSKASKQTLNFACLYQIVHNVQEKMIVF